MNKIDFINAKSLKKIDEEIENGGLKIEADAKKLAPVDTGNLRRLIVSKHTPLSSVVISRANYSQYVNYGTRKMKAQPYFTNAINLNKTKIIRNLNKALNEVLK